MIDSMKNLANQAVNTDLSPLLPVVKALVWGWIGAQVIMGIIALWFFIKTARSIFQTHKDIRKRSVWR